MKGNSVKGNLKNRNQHEIGILFTIQYSLIVDTYSDMPVVTKIILVLLKKFKSFHPIFEIPRLISVLYIRTPSLKNMI